MAHWFNVNSGETLPTGPETTLRLEAEQAETRSLNGWTLCSDVDVSWARAKLSDVYGACRRDIYELAYWMGTTPTGQQCVLLDAVQAGDDRIAAKSGQGPGKTTITTIVAAWWAIKWEDSMTIVTAPSMNLAEKVWVAEFNRTLKRAHPMWRKSVFTPYKKKIQIGNEERHPNWGIWPATASTAEGIAGKHENHMNILVEEASGMEDHIMETLFGTGTNVASDWNPDAEKCSYLLIGNPTRTEGTFYRVFTDAKEMMGWRHITFNAERCPIVAKEKVEREARVYGRESAYYRVRVLGEFPDSSDNLLFSLDDLEKVSRTPVKKAARALGGDRQWGHDLARQGGDETVSYFRVGGAVIKQKQWASTRDFEPAHAIRWSFGQDDTLHHTDQEEILHCFDAIGVGQGVVHLFVEAHKNYYMFHAQGTPMKKRQFFDQITEAWFWLAKLVRLGVVYIPRDDVLWRQLTSRRYQTARDGRWQIEPKKDYIKRIGRGSPDRADALVMCFYNLMTGSRSYQRGEDEVD
jgi:hypothetical protein